MKNIIHSQIAGDDSIKNLYNSSKRQTILHKELGHCTKIQAHIQPKPNAIPKFFKLRPIPFVYISDAKEELERHVQSSVIEHTDTSSWAAPIVPAMKPNGKIRICGNFKVTINPQILVNQHPIPSIDELMARLNHGQKFTKLDLSDACLLVELDARSKKLVVINTPSDLFRYNRMPFGISNAPALF